MLPMVKWLVSISAGLTLSIYTMNKMKVANGEEDNYIAEGMNTSAVYTEPDEPYILGSEQINAALQQILSSDNIDLYKHSILLNDTQANIASSDYTLGSESLNRMLEEILASPCNDNDNASGNADGNLPQIEPAIQL